MDAPLYALESEDGLGRSVCRPRRFAYRATYRHKAMKKPKTSKPKRPAVKVQRPCSPAFRRRLAGRLKETREFFAEMTQAELASKSGLSAMHISHFECGRRLPSLENFAALVRALDTNAEYMLGLDEPENDKLCNSPEAARAQGEKGIESR